MQRGVTRHAGTHTRRNDNENDTKASDAQGGRKHVERGDPEQLCVRPEVVYSVLRFVGGWA